MFKMYDLWSTLQQMRRVRKREVVKFSLATALVATTMLPTAAWALDADQFMGNVALEGSETGDEIYSGVTVTVYNNGKSISAVKEGYAKSKTLESGEWKDIIGVGYNGAQQLVKVVTGNSVIMSVGKAWGSVIGGINNIDNANANTSGNKVTVSGGVQITNDDKSAYISGGESFSGTTEENIVTISGSDTYVDVVRGGLGLIGSVKNIVTVGDGAKIGVAVTGGFAGINGSFVVANGSAKENEVTIDGGTIGPNEGAEINGGLSYFGVAESNKVTIKGGTIAANVYGGNISTSGAATNNTVTLSGGTLGTAEHAVDVYGGYSPSGTVTGNTVAIVATSEAQPDLTNANLYGSNNFATGKDANTLDLTGMKANLTVKSISNFDALKLEQDTGILTVTGYSDLGNTTIDATAIKTLTDDEKANGRTLLLASDEAYLSTTEGTSVTISAELSALNEYAVYSSDVVADGVAVTGYMGKFEEKKISIAKSQSNNIAGLYIDSAGKGRAVVNGAVVEADKGTLTISGDVTSAVTGKAITYYGSYAEGSSEAKGGELIIKDSAKTDNIYGGYSVNDAATENSVTMSAGKVSNLYGGFTVGKSAAAYSNTVKITNGEADAVHGGHAEGEGAAAYSNTVNIAGGTIGAGVCGGHSKNGIAGGATEAAGNKVIMTAGEVSGSGVIGGSGKAGAQYNSVEIKGGTVIYGVKGGTSYSGYASNNTVTISGGSEIKEGDVVGGTGSSTATSNTVVLCGSSKVSIVAGGNGGNVYGGKSTSGAATGNSVEIKDEVAIVKDKAVTNVYGGYSENGVAGAADAGNKVVLTGGTVQAKIYGGSGSAGAQYNSVEIKGGTVQGYKPQIGLSEKATIYGGYSASGAATNNTVTLSGGTLGTDKLAVDVYAGYSATGTATGNTVAIVATSTQAPTLTYANLYGSNKGNYAGNDNVLDLSKMDVSVTAKSITAFGKITMGTGVLTVTASSDLSDTTIDATAIKTLTEDEKTNGRDLIVANGDSLTTTNATVKVSDALNEYIVDTTTGVTGGVVTQDYKGDITATKISIVKGDVGTNVAGVYYDSTGKGYNAEDLTSGKATSGTLTISSDVTSTKKTYYGAYAEGEQTATGGILVIGTSGKTGTIYGGYSVNGSANKNIVTIAGSTIVDSVYGGNSISEDGGSANENTVTIAGGTIGGSVYGGNSEKGSASKNTVTVSSGAQIASEGEGLYGGFSRSGSAEGNIVEIKGSGTTVAGVCGGDSEKGSANKNTVTVSDGAQITAGLYGGVSEDEDGGSANENTVTIAGGTIGTSDNPVDVYGGFSSSGTATGNTVAIVATSGAQPDLTNANLYGSNIVATGKNNNTLDLSGMKVDLTAKSINNFDAITMGKGTLTVAAASNLTNTTIDAKYLTDVSSNYNFTFIQAKDKAELLTVTNATLSLSEAVQNYRTYLVNTATDGVSQYKYEEVINTQKVGIEFTQQEQDAGIYIVSDSEKYSKGHLDGTATSGTLNISGTLDTTDKTYAGAYAEGEQTATNGTIAIGTSANVTGDLYAGYSASGSGSVTGNTMSITGAANLTNAKLYGSNEAATGTNSNALDISTMTGNLTTQAISNFDSVKLGSNTITVTSGASDLANTTIDATAVTTVTSQGYDLITTSDTGTLSFDSGTKILLSDALKASCEKVTDAGTSGGIRSVGYTGNITTQKVSITKSEGTNVAGVYYDSEGKGYNAEDLTSGTQTSGTLTISGDVTIIADKTYYGAYAEGSSEAKGGALEVTTDGKVGFSYGGYSESGKVTGNTASITGGEAGNVYGGNSSSDGTVMSNTATIAGGTVTGSFYGGYSQDGTATSNTTTVKGGTVKKSVYGGYSGGNATSNVATITDGTVEKAVYGGRSFSTNGAATSNTVTLKGGTIGSSENAANVYGGYSDSGAATNNTVTLEGGTVGTSQKAANVYGGYSGSGAATGNKVAIVATSTQAPDLTNANLYGSNKGNYENNDNLLDLSGMAEGVEVKSIEAFGKVTMGVGALTVTAASNLTNTTIDAKYLTDVSSNKDYTFIQAKNEAELLTVTKATLSLSEAVQNYRTYLVNTATDGVSQYKYEEVINTQKVGIEFTQQEQDAGIYIVSDSEKYSKGHLDGTATSGTLNISGELTTTDKTYAGAYAEGSQTAKGGTVAIGASANVTGDLYAGYSASGSGKVESNTMTVADGATLANAKLHGSNKDVTVQAEEGKENVLDLTVVSSATNIASIDSFDLVKLGSGTITVTADSSFANATIDATNITKITGTGCDLIVAGDGVSLDVTNTTVELSGSFKASYEADTTTGGVYTVGYEGKATAEKISIAKSEGTDVAGVYYDSTGNGYNAEDLTSGTQTSGTLTISTDVTSTGKTYCGAYAEGSSEAKGGTLEVKTDGTISMAYGGYSKDGAVTGNTATIAGGTVGNLVYGGKSDSGAVTNNTVDITGGTVKSAVGGYSVSGNVTDNTVNITGGTVKNVVYGGYSGSGTATGNTVAIVATSEAQPNLTNANLYGSNKAATGKNANTLDLTKMAVDLTAKSINNFDAITMGAGKLTVTAASNLANTTIDLTGISPIEAGQSRAVLAGTLSGIDTATIAGVTGGYKLATGTENGVAREAGLGAELTSSALTVTNCTQSNVVAGLFVDTNTVARVYDASSGKVVTKAGQTEGTLTITGTELEESGKIYAGAYAEGSANVSGTLNITKATITGDVYGGCKKTFNKNMGKALNYLHNSVLFAIILP